MSTEGHVFISYSSERVDSAIAFRRLMEEAGIPTWMAPKDIPPGKTYAQVIVRAIKNCSCFLLLLTEPALSSIWVPKETEWAVNYGKLIVPVLLEDVDLNEELELYIATSQIIKVDRIEETSEAVQSLLETLQKICGCFPESGEANPLPLDK